MGLPNLISRSPNVLILAGTTEARETCAILAQNGIRGTASLAGRVERPQILSLPMRVGGFGGPDGLARYIRDEKITHIIDATHPFAPNISANVVEASHKTHVPLAVLQRPPWQIETGDTWINVPDITGAVNALDGHSRRVFLGIGRQNLAAFSAMPQHHYVSRVIDPLQTTPDLPSLHLISARGPFRTDDDIALFQQHRIDIIVSKNSGGAAAKSKIDAARVLQLPVIMIDRPIAHDKSGHARHLTSPNQVLDWLRHDPPYPGANLGV